MDFKNDDGLKSFLNNNEKPLSARPLQEWNQIEARIHREEDKISTVQRHSFRDRSVGAGLCFASFMAVFLWMSSLTPTRTPVAPQIVQTMALAGDAAFVDSEEFLWAASLTEDDGLEELEQAFMDRLEY